MQKPMDLKRERVKKWEYADHAQRRRTLGCLTSEQFHHPKTPVPQTPPLSWTVRLMQCLAARLSHFGLLFSFLFYLILFSEEMRDILGKFWIHSCWSSTVERDTLQLKKRLCLSPLSSLTGLMAANGQSKLCGKSTQIKGERQFPGRCTTEL